MVDVTAGVVPTANPYAAPPASNGDKQATPGPTPKKWAGKFENEVELEKGYENQQTVLTERSEALRRATERINQLEQMVAGVAERMSPAARTEQRSSRAQQLLEAQGIAVEALEELIDERASAKLPKAVEEFMAPFTQGARAQETLAAEFPGVSIADVNQFLSANPEVNRTFKDKGRTSPTEALYYAYAQYAMHKPAADLSGQTRARMDAALPGTRGGTSIPEESANDVAAGWDKFQQTGNIMEFLRPRLAHVINKTG